eukprot:g2276.t1
MRTSNKIAAASAAILAGALCTKELDIKLAHAIIKFAYYMAMAGRRFKSHLTGRSGMSSAGPEIQALIDILTLGSPRKMSLFEWRFIMRAAIWNNFLDGPEIEKPGIVGGVPCMWYRWNDSSCAQDRVIIHLHGGGYCAGRPRSYRTFCGILSRGTGMRVCSVDYRLAPENPLPAAVEDSLSVYRALVEDCGILPQSVALCGDSAGGGLVLLTLQAIRDAGLPIPAAGVPISPWADLSNSGESHNTTKDIMLRRKDMLDEFALRVVGGSKEKLRDPSCSPIFGSFKGLPPLYVTAGDNEALRSDAVEVCRRARGDGVDAILDTVQHMPHIFPVFCTYLPEGAAAVARICDFINEKCENNPRACGGDRVRARL